MRNLLDCMCSEKAQGYAPLVLRVVTGVIFAMHGWMKFVGGVDGTAGFLGNLGFPAPEVFAVLLIAAELGGGILLILGAFTHWVSKILVIVSVIALVTVHLKNGFFLPGGYEFILLLLAASVSLMITGAGKFSVDGLMKRKKGAVPQM